MQFRTFVTIISAILFVALMFFYFMLSPSYQKSASAKIYYYVEDYDKAYRVSKEAYAEDKYNRMAFAIMTQSETALNYLAFIDEANSYYDEINDLITQKSFIDKGDKYKIKMITDVVMDKYKGLIPTRLTDQDLIDEASKIYYEFEKINEKINEKL
jgi:tetratricopeptide (TPR) repeat protein